MRSRGLLESSSRASPIQRGDGDAILKSRRREEDGNKSAKESSVTFRMLVVLAGVACGFGFSSYSRIGANVQTLHRNVKGAYRAHNEAKKEYLKRYRESYLESLFASERIQEGEEIVEKGGNTPVAEVLATMTEVTKERVEEENEVDAGVSVTPASGTGLLPPSLSPSPPLPSPPPPPPPPPSPSPPPPPSPIQRKNTHVYIFNHLSDFGLGHLMQEFAKIYEICDMLNVGSVSIRECGTPNKPWHYSKMQSCKDRFGQNKNVVMYGKRSSDIDLSLGPNEETEDRDSFVHINGQVVNWIEVLENMTNPVTPTSVFVTDPHNMYIAGGKYSKVANNDACAGITKWFGDPSDFLLDELEKQRKRQSRGKGSKTHQNDIAFHFRLLDGEHLGIEIQPDLSIKLSEREIKVVDVRLDKEDGYGRLAHLDLKRAVDDVIDLAKKIFETSGLTTFVATDAPAIQAYLKDNPVISMIEHGGGAGDEKGEGWVTDDRDGNDSHYSLTSALEFYELGTAKKIVSFPFTSGFSRAASCLIEGGEYLGTVKTLDGLKEVIRNFYDDFSSSASLSPPSSLSPPPSPPSSSLSPPPSPPSSSPPPPLPPIQRKNTHVYIMHRLPDYGLGHLMKEFAKIYEICDTLNVGSVSIRECGTPNKPWHYSKMQSCKDRFGQNKNVVMYGKRSSDIDLSLGPNEETEDRDSFVHINGQVVNWIEVLENMTNPVTPTSVFVTDPHNMYIAGGKYSKVANNDACAGITKWFGDPSDFLLDELEKQRKRQSRGKGSKTHQNDIAFHFRLLDGEHLGIEIQPDLSIKLSEREIKVVDVRLDKEDGYGRLAHLDLKRAVDDVIDLAKKIFETSGLTTFVATDAPAIQAYLKDNPVISMIEHGGGAGDEKGEGWVTDDRDGNDSHYSLTSALEFYELGTAKKIVSFPFTSGFSRAASCLIEGGQYLGITTLDDLKKVIQNVSSSLA